MLLDQPQSARFARLLKLAPQLTIPHLVTRDRDQAQRFIDEAVRRGHEGVMAKATDARYVAGRRGGSWLKVKEGTRIKKWRFQRMAYTYEELKAKTIAELRDIAKDVKHDKLKAVRLHLHALNHQIRSHVD